MGRAKNSLKRENISSVPIKLKYSATYASSSFSGYGITTGSGINYAYNVTMSSEQLELMNRYRTVRQLYYQQPISASLNSASFWDPMWQSTAASGTLDSTTYSFPTEPTASVIIFAIPSSQFGEQISKKSFMLASGLSGPQYNIIDDGNGNLVDSLNSYAHVGNIFYGQGIVVITNRDYVYPSSQDTYITTQASEPIITEDAFNLIQQS